MIASGTAPSPALRLARRSFTAADQERFAAFSGDRNPMHMDAAAARRTQAGAPVVHGMHVCLWALDAVAHAGVAAARLRVDFRSFIQLDQPLELDAEPGGEGLVVTATQNSVPAVRLDLRTTTDARRREPGGWIAPEPILHTFEPEAPDLEMLDGRSGPIPVPPGAVETAAELFPHASSTLGAETVAAVGALSALVGMSVPGLHSIFSGLELDFTTAGGAPSYAVECVDPRFRVVLCRVAGPGFTGSVRAFARFPPVEPASLASLTGRIPVDAFAGRRALVVGGSRGLGAVTAKLIAAGGGHVQLTYIAGRAEADAIAGEINNTLGPDRCRSVAYDVTGEPAAQLGGRIAPPTHVYYFATGRIGAHAAPGFDPASLQRYLAVYATGLARLVAYLAESRHGARLHVLYPSTVYVERRPKGMTEYAMAKAAGEILCAELMRHHRGLTIATPRLPRTLTDQTATVPPLPAEDPVEVLLPLLLAEPGSPPAQATIGQRRRSGRTSLGLRPPV